MILLRLALHKINKNTFRRRLVCALWDLIQWPRLHTDAAIEGHNDTMSILNQNHIVRLASQLPCGMPAGYDHNPCGQPASVAVARPAEQPGAWQLVPVCRTHAENGTLILEFGDRLGSDVFAAYFAPAGAMGNNHQYEVRQQNGTGALFAVVNVDGFGIIGAAGPLTAQEVEVFMATQEAPWDGELSNSISAHADEFVVVWSQEGLLVNM